MVSQFLIWHSFTRCGSFFTKKKMFFYYQKILFFLHADWFYLAMSQKLEILFLFAPGISLSQVWCQWCLWCICSGTTLMKTWSHISVTPDEGSDLKPWVPCQGSWLVQMPNLSWAFKGCLPWCSSNTHVSIKNKITLLWSSFLGQKSCLWSLFLLISEIVLILCYI